MTPPPISRRALNRATLARQLLLERSDLPTLDAVEHLVGLQAQTPHTWYLGLWSRLRDFDPHAVSRLLEARELVRIVVMRSTIHLVSARDALALRPVTQPIIERSTLGSWGNGLEGIDREMLVAAGRALVEERPRTPGETGRLLAEQFPGRDPATLAQAIRMWVPLVQVPPRGTWGNSGAVAHTSTEHWLGRPLEDPPPLERTILRYLAAFGPASVRDVQTWSGLTRLRDALERLRPQLVSFADEHGRELFDLPDAPRPDPDVPAPVRFLYDYDNLLLSHHDRTRVIDAAARASITTVNGRLFGTFLLDGFVAGSWTIARERERATLELRPLARLTKRDAAALAAEAQGVLALEAASLEPEVRLAPAP